MDQIINIQAAKKHLSHLVNQALDGANVVLAEGGNPQVRMIPYKMPPKPRTGGQFAGMIMAAPNCWEPDLEVLGEAPRRPAS